MESDGIYSFVWHGSSQTLDSLGAQIEASDMTGIRGSDAQDGPRTKLVIGFRIASELLLKSTNSFR